MDRWEGKDGQENRGEEGANGPDREVVKHGPWR